jgi:hypothetical protein
MDYQVPEEFYFRLHFPRSRFNRRLEDMLLLLAAKIVDIGTVDEQEFAAILDRIIRENNAKNYAEKTIKNHRSEMIRLFGLVKYSAGLALPGKRLELLAQSQDIPQFFKSFCKGFQFPGGFLKADRVRDLVIEDVKFKPAKYILKLLLAGESKYKSFAISAAETTHIIFNDKRVTVNGENPSTVIDRVLDIRRQGIRLNKTSDVIRYARDFLNYMVDANLLIELKGMYSLNNKETKAIHTIVADSSFFDDFSKVIRPDGTWDADEYKLVDASWSEWFADVSDEAFETHATALLKDDVRFPQEWKDILSKLESRQPVREALKIIGDEGEKIAYEFEKNKVKRARPDLATMVKIVSSNTALGYDIISMETDQQRAKKYIEVKTTKKNYESDIAIPFLISINEWSVASQLRDAYYIYRVTITKEKVSIFVIRNPVKKHEEGKLSAEPTAYKIIYSVDSGVSVL